MHTPENGVIALQMTLYEIYKTLFIPLAKWLVIVLLLIFFKVLPGVRFDKEGTHISDWLYSNRGTLFRIFFLFSSNTLSFSPLLNNQ